MDILEFVYYEEYSDKSRFFEYNSRASIYKVKKVWMIKSFQ